MGIDFIHREWHERLDHIKWNMPGSLFLFDLVIYNIQLVNLIGRVFLFSAIEEPVLNTVYRSSFTACFVAVFKAIYKFILYNFMIIALLNG